MNNNIFKSKQLILKECHLPNPYVIHKIYLSKNEVNG